MDDPNAQNPQANPMGTPAPTQTPADPGMPAAPMGQAPEPAPTAETPVVTPEAPVMPVVDEKPEETGGLPPTGTPPAPAA